MATVEQLMARAEVTLLESGGVDNWDWYGDALADYTSCEDEFEDAEKLLSALHTAGVDNWEWYGESISGLSDYEDYLNSLANLDDALNVLDWKEQEEARLAAVPVVEPVIEPVVEKRVPKNAAEEALFAHIEGKFGADRSEEVFELAIEKGVWKNGTFPKEFQAALKVVQPGVANPLEAARQSLLAKVVKNGKLDAFLAGLA